MASLNDIANRALFKDQNIIINNNRYGIRLLIGNNTDWCGFEGYGNTDTNSGMIIYTGDNMDEPIKCRQYNYTGEQREIVLMDGNGNSHLKNVHSTKVYNAVWNDYAEFYPRGEQTEPGDIIQLDINSKEEKYIKATSQSTTVVGVHSDTYGHLIGGEEAPEGREFVEYNLEKYIPVGLVGRVNCKIIGSINKGDRIVVSEINGVGRKFNPETDNIFQIVGMAVEDKATEEIKKIKVNFRGGGVHNLSLFQSFSTSKFLGGDKWLV